MPAITCFLRASVNSLSCGEELGGGGGWVGLVSKLMPRKGLQEALFRGHPQDDGKCPLNRLGFVNS